MELLCYLLFKVEECLLEVVLEEFIEEEYVKEEVELQSDEVAQEVLKYYNNKVRKRELKQVGKQQHSVLHIQWAL